MGQGGYPVQWTRLAWVSTAVAGCLALANCAPGKFAKIDPKYGVSTSPKVVEAGQPVPKGGGYYRVGKPYTVAGRTYIPEEDINYRSEGIASWYGDDFHGRRTANGEVFDMHSISAAHPTLPLPCYVRVTNLANRRSIVVRVNDRGPYAEDRIIDLSVKTSQLLGFHDRGLARVRVEYVGAAPLEGSDDRQLIATLRDGEPAPAPSLVRVASAKPFLPDSGSTESVRGGKSFAIPQQRPYNLGQPTAESPEAAPSAPPSNAGPARIAASPLPPPVREAAALAKPAAPAAGAVSAPLTSPVSAFAATRYDVPAAFVSGRGLY